MPGFLRRRLTARQRSDERIETERILATARAVLAVSSLLAVYYDSATPFQLGSLVSGLLLLYSAHAFALLIVLRGRTEVPPRFSWMVHASDILWPTLIGLFTNGPSSPFFLYFIFALLAAAFRWGMREALFTLVASIATLAAEAIALNSGWLGVPIGLRFNPNGFVIRSVYLATFAFLIGYLAESEKRRRAEVLSITQIASKPRVDTGLKSTLQATLQEILKLFGGRELLLVAREPEDSNASLWRIEVLRKTGDLVFTGHRLDQSDEQDYLFVMPENGAGAVWRHGKENSTIMIHDDGTRVPGPVCLTERFRAHHPFDLLLASTVSAPNVSARLFLFEPTVAGPAGAQLRFLQELTNRVTPAVYNVYLLRRMRSRAAAVERARVARELHDGVVQSLHAIAFRLYALRTGSSIDVRDHQQELLDIQELVQNEASNLRRLMQQLKPLDFDPRHLVDFLTGMIERYRYDTGIAAKFVCDSREVSVPAPTCREIAGIIQEALANVLKHSGAENVLVCLKSQADAWLLTVDDDGRGFEFSGRFSDAQLGQIRRGPAIIKERVHAIGGELSIESKPGQGARLEIRVPKLAVPSLA